MLSLKKTFLCLNYFDINMTWIRPIKKPIYLTEDPLIHEKINVFDYFLLPFRPHPGGFGVKRRNHYHEGIDIYAPPGEAIYAVEDSIVSHIGPFTGEHCGSPWWENTQAIVLTGASGSVVYGEIEVNSNLKVGDLVSANQLVGKVLTVLKKDKGRPKSMLHLELQKTWTGKWESGEIKLSDNLVDPFEHLKSSILK